MIVVVNENSCVAEICLSGYDYIVIYYNLCMQEVENYEIFIVDVVCDEWFCWSRFW